MLQNNTLQYSLFFSVAECKEKWRNVRSAFVRSLKPPPSGSSAKMKKPYYLHDYVQFILPYVKPTNTIENPGNIEHPAEPSKSPDPTEDDGISEEISQEVQTQSASAITNNEQSAERATTSKSTTEQPTTQRKKKLNNLDSTFLEYLQSKKKNTDNETAKRYFLLSLLPEIKHMNDQQMRKFK